MTNKSDNIHENHRQRLRTRFLQSPQSLNKHELLELLLFYPIPRKNVNPEAHKLIDKFGSVSGVLNASAEDLTSVEGIGENTATFLTLIGKLIQVTSEEEQEEYTLFNFNTAKSYLTKFFAGYDREVFYAFFLSKTDKVIAKVAYTSEKINEINFLLSEFSRSFASIKPHAMIIAHNHPSGNATPSKKDDESTSKIYLLLSLSGIKLYDHVIVAGKSVYSYSKDGRLDVIKNSINGKFDVD